MKHKKLTKKEYQIYHTLYMVFVYGVWVFGAGMLVAFLFFELSNLHAILIGLSFFGILVLTATLNSIFERSFKNYQIDQLNIEYQQQLVTNQVSISSDELLSTLEEKGFTKISSTTYGFQNKHAFTNTVYTVSVRKEKRFTSFSDSNKLYQKIVKTFHLPTVDKRPKNPFQPRFAIVDTFEIIILESIHEQDKKMYIQEYALNTINKFHQYGVLYEETTNTLYTIPNDTMDSFLQTIIEELLNV